MQKEKPHPLLLIVFLLGISAVISGWESLALHKVNAAPAPAKQIEVKATAKVQDTTVQSFGASQQPE